MTVNTVYGIAGINSGLLKFVPAANANGTNYASFTFQVLDDGGTANGGSNLDPSPNTMTINVTAVNDAPTISNVNDVSVNEDTTAYRTAVIADIDSSLACNSTYLSASSSNGSLISNGNITF